MEGDLRAQKGRIREDEIGPEGRQLEGCVIELATAASNCAGFCQNLLRSLIEMRVRTVCLGEVKGNIYAVAFAPVGQGWPLR